MLYVTALLKKKKKVANIPELTLTDLNFLKQYILVFTFFSTELMFYFQFSLLSHTTPKYLYVFTLLREIGVFYKV